MYFLITFVTSFKQINTMKNLTAKNLKNGGIWCKNGFTVSYSGGKYTLVALFYSERFTKLKDLKNKMKNF